jgi:hypothetical protein
MASSCGSKAERVKALQERIKQPNCPRFVNFGDWTINTADIVGIFTPATMEEQSAYRTATGSASLGPGTTARTFASATR